MQNYALSSRVAIILRQPSAPSYREPTEPKAEVTKSDQAAANRVRSTASIRTVVIAVWLRIFCNCLRALLNACRVSATTSRGSSVNLAAKLIIRPSKNAWAAPAPRLLEINPVYAKLGAAFFPRCKTTKIMCSEFSTTEDSLHASKSMAHVRV